MKNEKDAFPRHLSVWCARLYLVDVINSYNNNKSWDAETKRKTAVAGLFILNIKME